VNTTFFLKIIVNGMMYRVIGKQNQLRIVKNAVLFLSTLCATTGIVGQITPRIEPPSWWTGMQQSEVQLMLYGAEFGQCKATIEYPGIQILSQACPQNINYLFVDIRIAPNAQPGTFPITLKSAKGQPQEYQFTLQARANNSSTRKGYDSSDVIYLITPDRFANGDITNDAPASMKEGINRSNKDGRHGGDIEGIRQQLNYLQNLGVTALWLNPVLENDMPKYSYHGYATTDFYNVDPRMGNNESFRQLTQEANDMGMVMIMDMIHNHCGLHHWWMNDLPADDWINYHNQSYTETNHQKTIHPDPYAAPHDLAVLEEGWFVPTMPDLNVTNPYLANYLINNSLWWIEYAGLAGIRMDTYLYPESGYMTKWCKRVLEEYPNFNITGEVWFDQPDIVSYWQKGKINPDGYVSHLPGLFDFPLHSAMVKALTAEEGWGTGWIQLYEMLAKDFQYPDPNNLMTFVDNHDMSRIYAQLDHDVSKVKMALAFVMTMRGIPQLYYGTEILMDSPKTRDDGHVRADFPGGWVGDTNNAFTGLGLTQDQLAMQSYVQHLLHWRKTASVVHEGNTQHYMPKDGVYVIFRYTDAETLMVILNKNTKPVSLPTSRFADRIKSATRAVDIITKQAVPIGDSIQLSAPGPTILRLE
jgi:glycosidase